MIRSLRLAGSVLIVLGAAHAALGAPVPSQGAKAAVKAYFSRIEKGEGADSDPLLAAPAKGVITELETYLESDSSSQQSHAARMIAVIGRQSAEKEVRRLAVKTLLTYATTDGKSRVGQALNDLLKFSQADFPPGADAEIEKLVRVNSPQSESLLLAGLLEVGSVKEDLKKLAEVTQDRSPFLNDSWSANLALARLGEAESVKHCVQAIEAEEDRVQRVRHFPDLVFIRHKDATKLLIQHLMSDERLPSVRENMPGSKVALYALDVLAQNVEGFPIKSEGPSYKEDQLATARNWVKEQKELKFRR